MADMHEARGASQEERKQKNQGEINTIRLLVAAFNDLRPDSPVRDRVSDLLAAIAPERQYAGLCDQIAEGYSEMTPEQRSALHQLLIEYPCRPDPAGTGNLDNTAPQQSMRFGRGSTPFETIKKRVLLLLLEHGEEPIISRRLYNAYVDNYHDYFTNKDLEKSDPHRPLRSYAQGTFIATLRTLMVDGLVERITDEGPHRGWCKLTERGKGLAENLRGAESPR